MLRCRNYRFVNVSSSSVCSASISRLNRSPRSRPSSTDRHSERARSPSTRLRGCVTSWNRLCWSRGVCSDALGYPRWVVAQRDGARPAVDPHSRGAAADLAQPRVHRTDDLLAAIAVAVRVDEPLLSTAHRVRVQMREPALEPECRRAVRGLDADPRRHREPGHEKPPCRVFSSPIRAVRESGSTRSSKSGKARIAGVSGSAFGLVRSQPRPSRTTCAADAFSPQATYTAARRGAVAYDDTVGRQATVAAYVLTLIAVVVGMDVLFFRHHFWERLIANVGIVLVFAAFYLRFRLALGGK
jgi:hypothetical protein